MCSRRAVFWALPRHESRGARSRRRRRFPAMEFPRARLPACTAGGPRGPTAHPGWAGGEPRWRALVSAQCRSGSAPTDREHPGAAPAQRSAFLAHRRRRAVRRGRGRDRRFADATRASGLRDLRHRRGVARPGLEPDLRGLGPRRGGAARRAAGTAAALDHAHGREQRSDAGAFPGAGQAALVSGIRGSPTAHRAGRRHRGRRDPGRDTLSVFHPGLRGDDTGLGQPPARRGAGVLRRHAVARRRDDSRRSRQQNRQAHGTHELERTRRYARRLCPPRREAQDPHPHQQLEPGAVGRFPRARAGRSRGLGSGLGRHGGDVMSDGAMAPQDLEAALRRIGAERYHHLHPFHKLLHAGKLKRGQVQAWALNRYYYQSRIPAKDASLLARLPTPELRRAWRKRLEDHDGTEPGTGGIARWLKLVEGVGLDRDYVVSTAGLLPATRFAVDAYVNFVRERSVLEAIASSLTELFSPGIIAERVSGMLANYDFITDETLAYFKPRLTPA